MPDTELAARIPLFPLPNVVLFPGALLPLHVFEPRYRQMAADALSGDGLIGMVLIRPGGDMMLARAPIFPVGCVGRVLDSRLLPDGRYNLILRGEQRFRITDELDDGRPYRSASVAWLREPGFEQLEPDLARKLEDRRIALESGLVELARLTAPDSIEVVQERMRELDPISLCNAVAFGLDCNPVEKQSLIECDDPLGRAELLLDLLELRTAEARLPDTSQTLN